MVTSTFSLSIFFPNNEADSEFWKLHYSCKFFAICNSLITKAIPTKMFFLCFTENDYLTRRQKTVTMNHFQKIDRVVLIGAKSKLNKMMKIEWYHQRKNLKYYWFYLEWIELDAWYIFLRIDTKTHYFLFINLENLDMLFNSFSIEIKQIQIWGWLNSVLKD